MAKVQYRSAVAREMPRAAAASGMVSPAKNRSLTSSALAGSVLGEPGQGVVEGEQVERSAVAGHQAARIELDPLEVAAVLEPALAASPFDQDAAHGLGRGGEEVAAAIPGRWRLSVRHQAQVRLVDQGRGLKRLSRLFLSQPLGRQLAELVVDQRQQLLGGRRVAVRRWRDRMRETSLMVVLTAHFVRDAHHPAGRKGTTNSVVFGMRSA